MAWEKDLMTFVDGLTDAAVMYSSLELKIFGTKNLNDMTFIYLTTLWMISETTNDRKDM